MAMARAGVDGEPWEGWVDLARWDGVVNLSASAVSCKNGVPTGMSITRFIKQCVLSSDFLPKKEIATETTVPTGVH